MILTEKNTNNKYKTISRYIKIRYTRKTGKPYIIHYNRRIHIDDILRLDYPVYLEDKDGKLIILGGYICLCNVYGWLFEIDDNGEYIRIWEQLETED